MTPELYRGSRCARCYWALFDGTWCQNPKCKQYGKAVGKKRVHLSNEEAAKLIAELKK